MQGGLLEGRLFLVEARLLAEPPIPLAAWGGVVAARLVKQLLGGGEAVVRVSPPLRPGGGVARGALREFVLAVLTTRSWRLVEALMGAEGLHVLSVSAREAAAAAREEAEEAKRRISSMDGLAVARIEYGPTAFVYRGRLILYPSPLRLIRGGLRALTELGLMSGEEAGEAFARLAAGVELLRSSTRVGRVDLGHGRRQLVFQGTALYGIDPDAVDLFALVLGAARVRGLGKSRGVGLGYIRVLEGGQTPR